MSNRINSFCRNYSSVSDHLNANLGASDDEHTTFRERTPHTIFGELIRFNSSCRVNGRWHINRSAERSQVTFNCRFCDFPHQDNACWAKVLLRKTKQSRWGRQIYDYRRELVLSTCPVCSFPRQPYLPSTKCPLCGTPRCVTCLGTDDLISACPAIFHEITPLTTSSYLLRLIFVVLIVVTIGSAFEYFGVWKLWYCECYSLSRLRLRSQITVVSALTLMLVLSPVFLYLKLWSISVTFFAFRKPLLKIFCALTLPIWGMILIVLILLKRSLLEGIQGLLFVEFRRKILYGSAIRFKTLASMLWTSPQFFFPRH